MHNVDDLILNIEETFKECDPRLVRNYRQEFSNYPVSKLEKVWEAIQENHNFAKAPEVGNIFKYMNMVGITRTKEGGNFYNRCTEIKTDGFGNNHECGTKYSIKSKFCPACNMNRTIKNPLFNSYEIVKTETMPRDLHELKELCATCNLYQKTKLVRGSKCSAWGTHDNYKKTGLKCNDCPCFDCCNEKPLKGYEHEKLKIKKV